MALKKTIIENNGIQTEYHKINGIKVGSKFVHRERVIVEKDGEKTTEIVETSFYNINATLVSYVSKDLREKSNALSVKEKEYAFTITAADFESKPLYQLAYAELKKLPQFADAEDC